MLLRIVRVFRDARDDERGVALAGVLALLAAGVILSSVIASSVVYAQSFSTSTRSGVQSQASAEAGIAAARLALLEGTCGTGRFTSASGPEYSAEVFTRISGAWVQQCPSSPNLDVKIVATGTAATPGVIDSSGDEISVEAVLTSASGSSSIEASGPAVYAYDAAGVGEGGTMVSVDGNSPDVLLKTGNVTCNGGFGGAATVVVEGGNFTGGGSCNVTGDVFATGAFDLNGGGKVAGSVIAKTVTSTGKMGGNVYAENALTMSWGGTSGGWASGKTLNITGGEVGGNAWARDGLATITGGRISGYLNSPTLSASGGTLNGGSTTYGSACIQTNVTLTQTAKVKTLNTASPCNSPTGTSWWGGWSKVQTQSSLSGPTSASPSMPSVPTVPTWIDFGAKPEDFTSSTWTGFTVVTMGTDCVASKFYAALQTIGTNPGVVDARNCSNGITFTGGSNDYASSPNETHQGFTFKNDIAIIAKKFDLAGSATFTGAGSERRLWLINPDTTANRQPNCNGQSMSIGGGFKTVNLTTLVYTPCTMNLTSSTDLKGQLFAGKVSIGGGSRLRYTPIGLPGYDLDTGDPSGSVVSESDRRVASQRNIEDAP